MNIVILAAGLGKRMYSSLPKVLQPVGGKPMLDHVLAAAKQVSSEGKIIVVVGHGAESVMSHLDGEPVSFALQAEQKGTGHAVLQAERYLDPSSPTLVLYGDVPLITADTLKKLVQAAEGGFGLLTIDLDDPTGYGRIIRENGEIKRIVEEKDADSEQKKVREVNTGFMLVPTPDLTRWLKNLRCDNNQQEYYLTDLVGMAASEGRTVHAFKATDPWEVEGANNKLQLEALERAYQARQAVALMKQGVLLADKNRLDIRGNLKCGRDVFIDVGCVFEGDVVIEDNVKIGPYCVIKSSVIGSGTTVEAYSHFDGATVGKNAKIGPFARLRPLAELSDDVHIGNFVEIKKSSIGAASKVNHLSYIGDTAMGSGVNIGAGTITCNYDGVNKFRTVIEDDCFIGSDTQLVAPVKVGKGATVGAGTTVTKNVSENVLVISRVRQTEIQGWQRPVKKKI
ncbi:bifunctional UDP-N-acetylglucosamine diphosphorylase/glucosamine-1-phosphate N-acetyltransferase GlmU [uncultured Parasutterella sp.]|uniref:bifunctional UDP-N-acetylglucosamine diphosphorylase/glucosamine-1-phosphate N-acetyltransferase GlmU n=1 Tax=uncultured Parasutterella sp. TaxID=1263098 RepID=UPI0025921F45|nr:bifunctional UDP-N-acetylglucosamine diphosphorylase/glucosamine-1-phosphate N-acetyltransferase GlmU [uncultured Parasutterella sp.]